MWCSTHHIRLSATYLRGKLNVLADALSRGGQDTPLGVDPLASGLGAPLGSGGQAVHRLVCDKVLGKAPAFCVSVPGPPSLGGGRTRDGLDEPGGLRVSSFLHSGQGNKESRPRKASASAGCASLAQPALVSGSGTSGRSSSHSARSKEGRTSAASVRHSSRKPANAATSRVGVIRDSLLRAGASVSTLKLVQNAHRESTNSVYASHWSSWSKWCLENNVNPLAPRSVQLANHLAWLADQGGSPSSLKVRRSAIASTLRQLGHKVNLSGVISGVIKGASLKLARDKTKLPAWDVFLVLRFLASEDFEPIHLASLANVTHKTLFLVLLATARRGSEVHALSGMANDISREKDGSFSLRFRPNFLAKNQKPGQPSPLIRIPPLSTILAPGDEDVFNCPVRALSSYLSRTQPIRSMSQKLLFISLNTARGKDISKVTLTKWVSSTIRNAYIWWQRQLGDTRMVLPLTAARTHEARAWASSLAVLRSGRLSEVLESAYWRSEDVFINFYLREVAGIRQDGSSALPSLVAAGQVLVD
ncbi:uncharacterized protein [Littorina saxatilis]|uniref:uncharacterized protein n=1 Tax=Littorina saxatilis TaxID=31220 RepID=UPI0038B5ECE4